MIVMAVPEANAQDSRTYWKAVQASCDATARKPVSELGRKVAKAAIDEFNGFGGHKIDANGRLFSFGLTEAEHEEDDGGDKPATVSHLGWWQVMKYWRVLFDENPYDKLEVRGFENASTASKDDQAAALLRSSAARLLKAADAETDPSEREVLREAALRAAITDTPWSAAFISYVIRQSGIPADGFRLSNAHRAYIYDAFATSKAEFAKQPDSRAYRACPLSSTKPHVGDLLCQQREPSLANENEAMVRDRIRAELDSGGDTRSIRRTHCEVVAYIDARARKLYSIGGNVNQSVTARKLNLRGDLRMPAAQKGRCGKHEWTLPHAASQTPDPAGHSDKCSLNDKNWFVLLQLR
jgi:hypothetical protein